MDMYYVSRNLNLFLHLHAFVSTFLPAPTLRVITEWLVCFELLTIAIRCLTALTDARYCVQALDLQTHTQRHARTHILQVLKVIGFFHATRTAPFSAKDKSGWSPPFTALIHRNWPVGCEATKHLFVSLNFVCAAVIWLSCHSLIEESCKWLPKVDFLIEFVLISFKTVTTTLNF